MHGCDIHVVTTAVVLRTVATVLVSKTPLANSHRGGEGGGLHTIEGRSRRNEYGAACRSCNRSGTWCGSCEGDHRQDQPF